MEESKDLSLALAAMQETAKAIASTWTFRYFHIVTQSSRGQDCPYARQALAKAETERPWEHVQALVNKLQALVNKHVQKS